MLCTPFPKKVSKAVQYGDGIKAHAVYLSQYQLLPYKRIQEYFADQLQMPISEGSLYNFNQQAYEQLAEFEAISKQNLIASPILHADETGININGKGHWLHSASNAQWTHFFPHARRGTVAMMRLIYYLSIMARYAMTIGNPITNMTALTHFAMPIT